MTDRQILNNILTYMKENKISKTSLAKKLGDTYRNIYRVFATNEKDKTQITLKRYLEICEALDKEPTFFIFKPLD